MKILKPIDEGKCRMYWQYGEIVEPLIMDFPALAKAEFIVMIGSAKNEMSASVNRDVKVERNKLHKDKYS
jgi:hypothetical protein